MRDRHKIWRFLALLGFAALLLATLLLANDWALMRAELVVAGHPFAHFEPPTYSGPYQPHALASDFIKDGANYIGYAHGTLIVLSQDNSNTVPLHDLVNELVLAAWIICGVFIPFALGLSVRGKQHCVGFPIAATSSGTPNQPPNSITRHPRS